MSDTSTHYVNNEEFFHALVKYKAECAEAEEKGEEIPPPSHYIGECIYLIATNLSNRPNFITYPYKEEMIGDAILNCMTYLRNFDPEKGKKPFAYYTQICWFAFVRRITIEKKYNYTKYAAMERMKHQQGFESWARSQGIDPREGSEALAGLYKLSTTDIKEYEKKTKKKKKKPVKKNPSGNLDSMQEEE